MVHGEVRPPLLDLANRDLIESHLSAVWLACTEATPRSIDRGAARARDSPRALLKPTVLAPMHTARTTDEAKRRIRRLLDLLEADLTDLAPWYPGRDEFAPRSSTGRVSASTRRSTAGATLSCRRTAAGRGPPHRWTTTRRPPRSGGQIRYAAGHRSAQPAAEGHQQPVQRLLHLPLPRHRGLPARLQLPAPAAHGLHPRDQRRPRPQTYLQRRASSPCPSSARAASSTTRAAPTASCVRCCRSATRAATVDTCSCPRSRSASASAAAPGTSNDQVSMCHACGTPLGDAEIVNSTYRIENVATQPRAHHRQRRGAPAAGLRAADHLRVGGARPRRRRAPRRRQRCRRRDRAPRLRAGRHDHPPQQGPPPSRQEPDPVRLQDRSGLGLLGEERRRGRRAHRSDGLATAVDRPQRAGPQKRALAPVDGAGAVRSPPSPPYSTRSCAASRPCSSSSRARSSPSRCPPATPAPASCSTRPPRAAPACSRGWSPRPERLAEVAQGAGHHALRRDRRRPACLRMATASSTPPTRPVSPPATAA
jgi:hypothetical protein